MNISHLFLRYIINKRCLLELKYLKSGMLHNSFTLCTTILTSHVSGLLSSWNFAMGNSSNAFSKLKPHINVLISSKTTEFLQTTWGKTTGKSPALSWTGMTRSRSARNCQLLRPLLWWTRRDNLLSEDCSSRLRQQWPQLIAGHEDT